MDFPGTGISGGGPRRLGNRPRVLQLEARLTFRASVPRDEAARWCGSVAPARIGGLGGEASQHVHIGTDEVVAAREGCHAALARSAAITARDSNVTPTISRVVADCTTFAQCCAGIESRRRIAFAVPYASPMSSANARRLGQESITSRCEAGKRAIPLWVQ